MKKIIVMSALLIGSVCVAQSGTGPRTKKVMASSSTERPRYSTSDGFTPVGVTVLPWSIPNPRYDVLGVRANLGWGSYRKVTGLDVGLFSLSEGVEALQINLVANVVTQESTGVQIAGIANYSGNELAGIQVSLITNVTEHKVRGIQASLLVNYADDLNGIQIGLININRSGFVFPFLNFNFK